MSTLERFIWQPDDIEWGSSGAKALDEEQDETAVDNEEEPR